MTVELVHLHDICLYPPPWTAHFGGCDEVCGICSEVFLRAISALLTAWTLFCGSGPVVECELSGSSLSRLRSQGYVDKRLWLVSADWLELLIQRPPRSQYSLVGGAKGYKTEGQEEVQGR